MESTGLGGLFRLGGCGIGGGRGIDIIRPRRGRGAISFAGFGLGAGDGAEGTKGTSIASRGSPGTIVCPSHWWSRVECYGSGGASKEAAAAAAAATAAAAAGAAAATAAAAAAGDGFGRGAGDGAASSAQGQGNPNRITLAELGRGAGDGAERTTHTAEGTSIALAS